MYLSRDGRIDARLVKPVDPRYQLGHDANRHTLHNKGGVEGSNPCSARFCRLAFLLAALRWFLVVGPSTGAGSTLSGSRKPALLRRCLCRLVDARLILYGRESVSTLAD
jgi:hypothetical protein